MAAKNGKSPGVDCIQAELCKNYAVILTLTELFNICFKFGKVPNMWNKGIITPIPKCSTTDPRDPLSYRGKLGVSTKFLYALKAIYSNVECSVRLNGNMTEWFNVNTGLKQGFVLSTVMFNIFINDLIDDIKLLDIGINIDGEKLSILLYADDIVLLAENAEDLQKILDVLNVWCNHNSLKVNLRKSNVIHFRNPSVARSDFHFSLNDENIEYTSNYQYLGLLLTEFLDYQLMAKAVARSASRALGLLIVKCKAHGGFQHNIYTKLFDTMVCYSISQLEEKMFDKYNQTGVPEFFHIVSVVN
ncbi:uncharacterized protein LOC134690258 [Mytilus trossulus]|uniref:uncharacterized protein LOC134690258 n=1 Tax=Mytilus trossulus TaxID=6551 RepID=UPI003006D4E2